LERQLFHYHFGRTSKKKEGRKRKGGKAHPRCASPPLSISLGRRGKGGKKREVGGRNRLDRVPRRSNVEGEKKKKKERGGEICTRSFFSYHQLKPISMARWKEEIKEGISCGMYRITAYYPSRGWRKGEKRKKKEEEEKREMTSDCLSSSFCIRRPEGKEEKEGGGKGRATSSTRSLSVISYAARLLHDLSRGKRKRGKRKIASMRSTTSPIVYRKERKG